MNLMMSRPQFAVRPDGTPQPQPVNGRVESTGVVAPDPMGPAAPRPTLLDFRVVYQTQVREALVDAIVDNAGVVADGRQRCACSSSPVGIDPPVMNPLYRNTSHRLVLRAKGDRSPGIPRGSNHA